MKVLALLLWICCSLGAVAQDQWSLVKSHPIDRVSAVSISNKGNVYAADSQGNIKQFDAKGEELLSISPQRVGKVSSIEAWQEMNIFVFYRDFQSYTVYDRFLRALSEVNLNQNNLTDLASLISPEPNGRVWMIDQVSLSLKKIDPLYQRLMVDNPLNLQIPQDEINPLYMRVYQNLIFISTEENNILIFDQFGNYIRSIATEAPISYFNFEGNTLYYALKNQLIKQDIYSKEVTRLNFPVNGINFYLQNGKFSYLFTEKALLIYQLD